MILYSHLNNAEAIKFEQLEKQSHSSVAAKISITLDACTNSQICVFMIQLRMFQCFQNVGKSLCWPYHVVVYRAVILMYAGTGSHNQVHEHRVSSHRPIYTQKQSSFACGRHPPVAAKNQRPDVSWCHHWWPPWSSGCLYMTHCPQMDVTAVELARENWSCDAGSCHEHIPSSCSEYFHCIHSL